MISISFLLFCALGIFAAVMVFAGAGKRLWMLPAAVMLALGVLTAFGLTASVIFSALQGQTSVQVPSATHVVQQVNGVTHTVVQSVPNFASYNSGNRFISVLGLNWFRILIFVTLIAFLVTKLARSGISSGVGHGFRRAWRVFAVIALIAFIFLGTVRTEYSISQSSNAAAQAAAQQAALEAAARQQILAAHPGANIISPLAAQNGIQAEMDQFDAPRIPVSPDAPAPPAAAAQPAASKAKTTKAVASTNKRKKPDKPPAANETKKAQVAAQSNSAGKATATKESSASDDKQAMVAEAESDKPKARPAWVDEVPTHTGNTRREVIATDLYASDYECSLAADVCTLLKTYERMQRLTGKLYSDGPLPSVTFREGQVAADGQLVAYINGIPYWSDWRISSLASMGIGAEYVQREIVAKDSTNEKTREYIDTVDRSFGPMKKLYRQIEFTPSVDNDLRRLWGAYQRRERFGIVGVGAGSILGFVGLVFGLLKIDTWTKGYYSKRLFIGVPAVIIAGLLLMSLMVGRPIQSGSGPTVPLPQGYAN